MVKKIGKFFHGAKKYEQIEVFFHDLNQEIAVLLTQIKNFPDSGKYLSEPKISIFS